MLAAVTSDAGSHRSLNELSLVAAIGMNKRQSLGFDIMCSSSFQGYECTCFVRKTEAARVLTEPGMDLVRLAWLELLCAVASEDRPDRGQGLMRLPLGVIGGDHVAEAANQAIGPFLMCAG
jgi:hypothetical protein